MHRYLLLFVLAGCLSGVQQPVRLQTTDGHAWGTSWYFVSQGTTASHEMAVQLIKDRITRLTSVFSTYEATSEIQRLNSMPIGATRTVSTEMYRALLLARRLCEDSNTAFWPLVGTTMIREGFEPETLPLQRTEQAGHRDCSLIDVRTSSFRRLTDSRLNLNALAEGLLLDAVAHDLKEAGISRYLFEFGGEMMAGQGLPGRGWKVAVEGLDGLHPFTLEKAALSSSGTYRNRRNGRSHLIDRNGHAIEELRATSVICASGALADGLSTTAALLTPEEAQRLIKRYPECALFYQIEGKGRIHTYRSANWPEHE